jgi:hypothetical protein
MINADEALTKNNDLSAFIRVHLSSNAFWFLKDIVLFIFKTSLGGLWVL